MKCLFSYFGEIPLNKQKNKGSLGRGSNEKMERGRAT